jgi:hypothetical protein
MREEGAARPGPGPGKMAVGLVRLEGQAGSGTGVRMLSAGAGAGAVVLWVQAGGSGWDGMQVGAGGLLRLGRKRRHSARGAWCSGVGDGA